MQKRPVSYDRLIEKIEANGLDPRRFANRAGVSWNTFLKLKNGIQVREDSIGRIVEKLEIRRSDIEAENDEERELTWSIPAPSNWNIVEILGPPTTASNGVCFQLFKLSNRPLPAKLSRAKLYQLAHVKTQDRDAMLPLLIRHAEVCEICKSSTRLSRNLHNAQLSDQSAVWVLDEWIDGSTILELQKAGYFKSRMDRVAFVTSEVLQALSVLHESGIVMRELSPQRVYVQGSAVVVTDFELAKIIQGNVTVRGEWTEENDYRAPENKLEHPSSDIFSWGRLVVFLLSGRARTEVRKLAIVQEVPEIANLLDRCMHALPSRRPQSAAEVLVEWEKLLSKVSDGEAT